MNFDPTFLRSIELALILGIGGLLMWAVKKFFKGIDDTSTKFTERLDKQDIALVDLRLGQADQRASFAELKTALVGMNGNNGMRGDIKELTTRVGRLEQRRAEDYNK